MKVPWRTVLGFGDEHLTFAQVHQRYRELTFNSTETDQVHALGDALEQARIELEQDEKAKPD